MQYSLFFYLDFRKNLLCCQQNVQHHDTYSKEPMSLVSPAAAHRRQQQPIVVVFNTDADTLNYDSEASINNAAETPNDESTFSICFAEVQCASHWRPLDLQGAALFLLRVQRKRNMLVELPQ